MTELMRQLTARKLERRKQLAALPVGEKLRMLEEMVAATQAISATRPARPAVPARKGHSPLTERLSQLACH
jgi:hypothetical protein